MRPGAISTPIVHSATFSFASLDAMNAEQARGAAGAFYQRHGHPTLHACEERLAGLDGAEAALLFSSGVAAIAGVFLSHLEPGDHVVALHQSYGGTHDLLNWGRDHFGWTCDLVDAAAPADWPRAFHKRTKLLHVETPTNPTLCILDLAEAAKLAHARGALLTVDNTFASPVGQRPLDFGADFVMYSATKSIGGHSDLLAGVVTGSRAGIEKVWKARKVFGPVPDPALAWQIERSLKTLALRVEAANANALELALRLAQHPGVVRALYPGLPRHPGHEIAQRQMTLGFGPVVTFEVAGGGAGARATVDALQLVRHAPSLGGVESLASLPAFTSHIQLGPEGRAKAGIPDGLVRLSVGVEDVEDLWADLDQALARACVPRA
ncbi:MAG: aminotransferase class I/II-fold pyridoxal phosphate-dependent enzyme [Candidatus Eisenbacteria bacterium]|nr:aminotransferase class I/II-fold pyridoxal phosphate-dependent enzyme [Candidatus Eisenbacteria bacterium]